LRTVVEGTVQDQTVGLEPVRLVRDLLCNTECRGTTADLTWGSDSVHLSRLRRSKVSFHKVFDLILKLDEAAVGCTWDILRMHIQQRLVRDLLCNTECRGTTADLTWGSDSVHLSRLHRSKVSFHKVFDLILKLDEAAVGCTRDILRVDCDGVDRTMDMS
nr:hypothetical protein [Tanacetum cinerariifolium]